MTASSTMELTTSIMAESRSTTSEMPIGESQPPTWMAEAPPRSARYSSIEDTARTATSAVIVMSR